MHQIYTYFIFWSSSSNLDMAKEDSERISTEGLSTESNLVKGLQGSGGIWMEGTHNACDCMYEKHST